MKKKKLIHFIFNLGRGGAETMLVRVIKELPEYENIVVTLFPIDHFGAELQCDKLICLNLRSLFQLPFSIFTFRKLVKREKPDMVHTHLFWPTFIARFAVPKRIPLITTIHAFIASSVEYTHWYIRFLDKISYRYRKSIIIVVAKGALQEYFSFLKLKPYKSYALYTFVDIGRFTGGTGGDKGPSPVFRVISVGALRTQKNYTYLVNAFSKMKELPIELHIYGTGNLLPDLRRQIRESGARVILEGEVQHIETIIPQYDLYVMSSSFEGFSLSVLEAMAMRMPLLLSDIPSFREQCEGIATFFSLSNPGDLIEKLIGFSKMPAAELKALGEKARERAVDQFTLQKHMEGLRKIYDEALEEVSSTA
ncbi:MAG: glycosyltransferase [Chitinophagaceae bacterium]|nr:glycosyltransferase [Chitinophagaceae bacterium]